MSRLLIALLALGGIACSDPAAPEPAEAAAPDPDSDGKGDGVSVSGVADDDFGPDGKYAATFAFKDLDDAQFVDHAAVPFLATALLQRRDSYDDAAEDNGFIVDIFDEVNLVPILVDLLLGLNQWNDVVNDDMADLGLLAAKAQQLDIPSDAIGFEPCGREIENGFVNRLVEKIMGIGAFAGIDLQGEDGQLTVAALCGLNRIAPTNRRLLQVILPDRLTIDVNAPAGFPNGRVLDEPITDIFFSISFIQQHLRSPLGIAVNHRGMCNGAPCDRFALSRVPLNPVSQRADGGFGSGNDRPYPTRFPYVAAPHVEDPPYTFEVRPRE